MADHEAAVRARLVAHAGTLALVGTRAYGSVLPQEHAGVTYMPAVVVQQISGLSEYVFGGVAGVADLRMQVDSWADTRAGCEALRAQVQDALRTYVGTQGSVTLTVYGMESRAPSWDPDAKLWRASVDFLMWGTE